MGTSARCDRRVRRASTASSSDCYAYQEPWWRADQGSYQDVLERRKPSWWEREPYEGYKSSPTICEIPAIAACYISSTAFRSHLQPRVGFVASACDITSLG